MGEAKRRKELGLYSSAADPYVEQAWRLRYVARSKAVTTVVTESGNYQLCQLMFGKDGSIYVQFPYFKHTTGLVSAIEFPGTLTPPATVSLQDQGKVSSHLVKFSHHPDGRVHFSQDGRIRTEIRRLSFRLDGPIGKIFELHAYHLSGFERINSDRVKRDRAYLQFGMLGPTPQAVILTAQWRRKRDIEANTQPFGQPTGPFAQALNPESGAESSVCFLGQPKGFPLRQHVLVIQCARIDLLDNVTEPLMIFMGGWDPHEVRKSGELSMQTGFLASMYPVTEPEELRAKIGSVDFFPQKITPEESM